MTQALLWAALAALASGPQAPSRAAETYAVQAKELWLGDGQRVEDGVLLVRAGSVRQRVAIHDLPPRVVAVPGDPTRGGMPPDRSDRVPPGRDLAGPFLLAAALLLVLEWWWHHRTTRLS